MKLWDWVMDKLTVPAGGAKQPADNPDGHAHTQSGPSTGAAAPQSTATAIVEPVAAPPEPASSSTDNPVEVWWSPADATLVELTALPRPELDAEARALEAALIEDFDGHNLTLPPLPRVPERVLARMSDRRSGAKDVANEIAEDQVTAAAVLRIANSPLYRGLEKITALEPAVVRLGNTALRTLMLHQSMRAVALHGKHADDERAEALLIRALASAAIMRALSAYTPVDADDAFMIGLLHDIGALIVLRTTESQQNISHNAIDDATFEYLCQETHQEFGELIADAWNLPERLKSLIADHHRHPADDDPYRTERLLLQLTEMICALLGYAPAAPYNLLETRAAIDLRLAERPGFTDFLASLPEELDHMMDAFM